MGSSHTDPGIKADRVGGGVGSSHTDPGIGVGRVGRGVGLSHTDLGCTCDGMVLGVLLGLEWRQSNPEALHKENRVLKLVTSLVQSYLAILASETRVSL